MSIGNTTPSETQKQQYLVAPPPSLARKQKAPGDCYSSFIDEIQNGLYGGSILVKNSPRTNRDIYFKFRPRKARPTEMRSIRRHYSHKSVALYRTKKEGSTRKNIEFMTCSFLELDGSNDSTIKTQVDVFVLISKNNLSTATNVIQTSLGHFHVIWNYNRPLPWTEKFESYWISQQKRLIQLFEKGGFLVDKGASLNPTQNLRNPSQLNPYNYKRRCKVHIHSTYKKTSLRAIYRALNKTSIPNPRRLQASVLLRRFLRANQTFEITLAELAENLNMSLRTVKTQVSRAVQNGDLRIVARLGNNGEKARTTHYESLLYIEKFPEVQLSISNNNSLKQEVLLRDFQANGAENGRRQKTIFALGLEIKSQLGERAHIGAIRAVLEGGARLCHFPEREFERTLKNIMKPAYSNPLSLSKMRAWDLLEGTNNLH